MEFDYDRRQLALELADVLLTDPMIARIDFAIETSRRRVSIVGWGIRRLGIHLKSGQAQVEVKNLKHRGHEVDASYSWRRDRLIIPTSWVLPRNKKPADPKDPDLKYALTPQPESPFKAFNNDLERRATLVHEATHAWFDVLNVPLMKRYEEAAAWLAQFIYQHHQNPELDLRNSQDLYHIAGDSIARKYGLYNRLGVVVPAEALDPLVEKLRATYGGLRGFFRHNGIG